MRTRRFVGTTVMYSTRGLPNLVAYVRALLWAQPEVIVRAARADGFVTDLAEVTGIWKRLLAALAARRGKPN